MEQRITRRGSSLTQDEPLNEDNDRYIVPGLKRGLMILQLFNASQKHLSMSEIARQIRTPRSSTFRLLYTLEYLGFLERTADGNRFKLSSGVLGLGFSYLASLEVVELAREPLYSLRSRTLLSTNLAVRDGRDIVHLICLPSLQAFTANVQVGVRRPAHATPMGRALLSELSAVELSRLYPEQKLERVTGQTPATLKQLLKQLDEDRARGYVVSYGTYSAGGCSVAAPVRDSMGQIAAAINIVAPREGREEKDLQGRLKNEVIATAEEISRLLGFGGKRSRAGQ